MMELSRRKFILAAAAATTLPVIAKAALAPGECIGTVRAGEYVATVRAVEVSRGVLRLIWDDLEPTPINLADYTIWGSSHPNPQTVIEFKTVICPGYFGPGDLIQVEDEYLGKGKRDYQVFEVIEETGEEGDTTEMPPSSSG